MNRAIKNLVLTVSIAGLGTAVAGARPVVPLPPPSAATNTHGPRIQFETPTYDFGRVEAGEPVKHTYYFTNTGDANLIINSVQPQCGCTTAGAWTRQVEPGKSGEIPIQFNTTAYNGQVFKQVTVNCNITNQPLVFIQLKGSVFRPYEVIPPLAVMNLAPDVENGSMVVTITNHTAQPLILSSPACNNRMFSAELITNDLGRGYQLKLATVPPLAAGSVQGQITIRTSWTNSPVIPVTVVANIQPAVMVIPSYVTLGPGPLAVGVTNAVTIQNNSTNLLEVSDPVVNVPGVEAQVKETRPGKTFSAILGFPQGFQITPGQQVLLTCKTTNAKFPTIRVPVLQMPRPVQPAQVRPPLQHPVQVPTVVPGPINPTPIPAHAAVSTPPVQAVSSATPPVPPRPPLPPRPPPPGL